MIIERKDPPYPRRGPPCLLALIFLAVLALGIYVIVRPNEARDTLATILPTPTAEPTRSAAEYALLADLSESDGEFEEAVTFYQTAIQLDATRPEFYIRLINLLVEIGQPDEALAVAEQATVLAPDSDAVWTAVAAAYLANGDRLSDAGDPTGADLEYAKAVEAADRAIDINPQNATAYAYKAGGLAFPEDPAKYERAQEAADFAVALEPDNPLARYYMAVALTNQGFYTAAREQFQLGIQADASDANLYIGLAYNFFGSSDVPRAILSFQDAIEVDPDNAVAYDGLAYMYLQLGENPLAEENARKAVEFGPNLARAHGRLGEALFNQNNYEEAAVSLTEAVRLYGEPNPINARFFNMLATAYIREDLNNCDKAAPLFEQVVLLESFVQESAQEGLDACRQAQLGTAP